MRNMMTGIALLGILFSGSVHAVNFDGGGDGVDWNDPLNWVGDVLPGPSDTVNNINGYDAVLTNATVISNFENWGLPNGSLTIKDDGKLDTGSFEILRRGRRYKGHLIVKDGGELDVGGSIFIVHYDYEGPATGILEIANGGVVSCTNLRNGDTNSNPAETNHVKIIMSGEGSSLTTTSNSTFPNSAESAWQTTVELAGGTFTSSGRDFWGGQLNFTISGGTYDHNSDQLHFGSSTNSIANFTISDGLFDTAGYPVWAAKSNTTINLVQSGGEIRLSGNDRDFQLGWEPSTRAYYTLSGGTNNMSRHMYVPRFAEHATVVQTGGELNITNDSGNLYIGNYSAYTTNASYSISGGVLNAYRVDADNGTPCMFEVIGSDGVINITDDLYVDNANTTLKFTIGTTGVSTINAADEVQLNGATLEVDLSEFNFETRTLTLVDCGNLNGTFGTVNIIGEDCSADVVYDTTADELRLENISGPSRGTVLIVK